MSAHENAAYTGATVPEPRQRAAPDAAQGQDPCFAVGTIEVYPERYEVRVDGQAVALTLTQFRLLEDMARRPGWVVEHAPCARRNGTLKHHIAALRARLGPAGARQIQTVRGAGYRLVDTAARNAPPPDR